MINIISKTIDELNERMETSLDDDNLDDYEVIKSFYDWFVEVFVL